MHAWEDKPARIFSFLMHNIIYPPKEKSKVFLIHFIAVLILLSATMAVLISSSPDSLSFGYDFVEIAWKPGRELLATGSVYVGYPYPLWTVVVMLPFSFLPVYTASVIWLSLNILMLSFSIAALISMFDQIRSPVLIALAVSLSIFYIPVLHGLGLGQLTFLSLFTLTWMIHFFLKNKWTWLGITLGLSFLKPHLIIMPVGFLLLWAMWQRKWNVLISFTITFSILVIVSLPFISTPRQIIGGGIEDHVLTYVNGANTIWGMFLGLGISWVIPFTICLVLILWNGWVWLPALKSGEISFKRLLYLLSISITTNLIILPYGWTHNFILLLLPFWFSLSLIWKKKSWQRTFWLSMIFVVVCPATIIVINIIKQQNLVVLPAVLLAAILHILEDHKPYHGKLNVETLSS